MTDLNIDEKRQWLLMAISQMFPDEPVVVVIKSGDGVAMLTNIFDEDDAHDLIETVLTGDKINSKEFLVPRGAT